MRLGLPAEQTPENILELATKSYRKLEVSPWTVNRRKFGKIMGPVQRPNSKKNVFISILAAL